MFVAFVQKVVSYLFPISNHNLSCYNHNCIMLYLISFLYQTTTIWFHCMVKHLLYLISFLYQTTTLVVVTSLTDCCILSLSYIKPQQIIQNIYNFYVVSYLFPISNHNYINYLLSLQRLYLISFLYQTTTIVKEIPPIVGCILSLSYIKPQLLIVIV